MPFDLYLNVVKGANPCIHIDLQEEACNPHNNIIMSTNTTVSRNSRKPRTNLHRERDMSCLLFEGQRVRQKTWIGVYHKQKNAIYHDGIAYKSFNQFAKAYYIKEIPKRSSCSNAWLELDVEVDDTWIKLNLLHKDVITSL
jgi:hypothetical protein